MATGKCPKPHKRPYSVAGLAQPKIVKALKATTAKPQLLYKVIASVKTWVASQAAAQTLFQGVPIVRTRHVCAVAQPYLTRTTGLSRRTKLYYPP